MIRVTSRTTFRRINEYRAESTQTSANWTAFLSFFVVAVYFFWFQAARWITRIPIHKHIHARARTHRNGNSFIYVASVHCSAARILCVCFHASTCIISCALVAKHNGCAKRNSRMSRERKYKCNEMNGHMCWLAGRRRRRRCHRGHPITFQFFPFISLDVNVCFGVSVDAPVCECFWWQQQQQQNQVVATMLVPYHQRHRSGYFFFFNFALHVYFFFIASFNEIQCGVPRARSLFESTFDLYEAPSKEISFREKYSTHSHSTCVCACTVQFVQRYLKPSVAWMMHTNRGTHRSEMTSCHDHFKPTFIAYMLHHAQSQSSLEPASLRTRARKIITEHTCLFDE